MGVLLESVLLSSQKEIPNSLNVQLSNEADCEVAALGRCSVVIGDCVCRASRGVGGAAGDKDV